MMLTLQIAAGSFLGGVGLSFFLAAWNWVDCWCTRRRAKLARNAQDERNKSFETFVGRDHAA